MSGGEREREGNRSERAHNSKIEMLCKHQDSVPQSCTPTEVTESLRHAPDPASSLSAWVKSAT